MSVVLFYCLQEINHAAFPAWLRGLAWGLGALEVHALLAVLRHPTRD